MLRFYSGGIFSQSRHERLEQIQAFVVAVYC